jgi:hypothetical protein
LLLARARIVAQFFLLIVPFLKPPRQRRPKIAVLAFQPRQPERLLRAAQQGFGLLGQPGKIHGVAMPGLLQLAVRLELFAGILLDDLKQAVAHVAGGFFHDDQRSVDQRRE